MKKRQQQQPAAPSASPFPHHYIVTLRRELKRSRIFQVRKLSRKAALLKKEQPLPEAKVHETLQTMQAVKGVRLESLASRVGRILEERWKEQPTSPGAASGEGDDQDKKARGRGKNNTWTVKKHQQNGDGDHHERDGDDNDDGNDDDNDDGNDDGNDKPAALPRIHISNDQLTRLVTQSVDASELKSAASAHSIPLTLLQRAEALLLSSKNVQAHLAVMKGEQPPPLSQVAQKKLAAREKAQKKYEKQKLKRELKKQERRAAQQEYSQDGDGAETSAPMSSYFVESLSARGRQGGSGYNDDNDNEDEDEDDEEDESNNDEDDEDQFADYGQDETHFSSEDDLEDEEDEDSKDVALERAKRYNQLKEMILSMDKKPSIAKAKKRERHQKYEQKLKEKAQIYGGAGGGRGRGGRADRGDRAKSLTATSKSAKTAAAAAAASSTPASILEAIHAHPSWEASRKLKEQQQKALYAFSGTKIQFGEDD